MHEDYRDLTVKDFFNGNAREYMDHRFAISDTPLEDGVYDEFGADKDTVRDFITFLLFLYKFYFRVEVHGIENLPAESPGLMVSNHAPILPMDAMMIGTAALVEPERPRLPRAIINKAISAIPYFSTLMARAGQVIGCEDNVRRVFEQGKLMLVFPTGAQGRVHSIFNKYRLDKFSVGFMEYALRYHTPIIPTCVTGSEESAMALGELNLPVAGFNHLPLTPIFPWFGLLGLVPLPSKFDIYFEEPVDYSKEHADDVDDPEKVKELVEDIRGRIQDMLDDALGRK